MHKTRHVEARMGERGISVDMIELAIQYGEDGHGDKTIFGRKEAERLLRQREREIRALKRIVAKGGIVLVAANDALITTYPLEHSR